jgi:uncharacterized membrane protein
MTLRSYGRLRIALTVIGLAIAAYLTLLHYVSSVPLACGSGSVINCETVLSSPASMVLGVPVAVWGLLWFAVAFVLALMWARASGGGEPPHLRAAGLAWTLVGTATVLWLVYQEIAEIGRICIWCTAIHVLVLALLVIEVRADQPPEAAGP